MLTHLVAAWRSRSWVFLFEKRVLHFRTPAQTSRNILRQKPTWFFWLATTSDAPLKWGRGEGSFISGLSLEREETYPPVLEKVKKWLSAPATADTQKALLQTARAFPSLACGLEMAFLDWQAKHRQSAAKAQRDSPLAVVFSSPFTAGTTVGMPVNGLVWMDSFSAMRQQAHQLLEAGFSCLKLKIGHLDFEKELSLLHCIRTHPRGEKITLRLDANGAFSHLPLKTVKERLKKFSQFNLHSLEQPLQAGETQKTAELVGEAIVPIALDEELIGHYGTARSELLRQVQPDYLVLKPSLLGGVETCEEWLVLAKKQAPRCGWWVTSALESNLGLTFLAQWRAALPPFNATTPSAEALPAGRHHQGLGTGGLYTNNLPSPLQLEQGMLYYRP